MNYEPPPIGEICLVRVSMNIRQHRFKEDIKEPRNCQNCMGTNYSCPIYQRQRDILNLDEFPELPRDSDINIAAVETLVNAAKSPEYQTASP